MNVHPINMSAPQHNSQPSFNGYVDKPVIKIINKLAQKEMNAIVKTYNQANEKVNVKDLQNVKSLWKNSLKKFSLYMERLHKKSVLTLDKDKRKLVIKNKDLDTEIDFYNFDAEASGHICKGGINKFGDCIDASSAYLKDLTLKITNDLANTLYKSKKHREIDNFLFEQYTEKLSKQADSTSFFAGLKTKRNGKKADKLAPEFNQPTGWLDKLLEIRNNAIQRKEKVKRLVKEQKMLKKANAREVKRFAKEQKILEKANARKAKEILEK